jgi:diaminopimelate epimerase
MTPFIKAHAYGNDFLYVPAQALAGADLAACARRLCDRHRGLGADGLILYTVTDDGATMKLLNADGSDSELSGNGLRGLAAIIARIRVERGDARRAIDVDTTAGRKRLTLQDADGSAYLFAAEMGQPEGIHQATLDAGGERVTATVLSVGNPQCVVLGPLPDDERFTRLGAALERHPYFPNRTNVEFAEVESRHRIRIRIWERGVGPTESSGTGSCGAAVAAATHGGAARSLEVAAPGGSQQVVWTDDGLTLTGWAEIVADGTYRAQL